MESIELARETGSPDEQAPASSAATTVVGIKKLSSLTIVLPCFNEAENVAEAVAEAAVAARAFADEFEIIVVDDGSSDATFEIATALDEASLTVVQHPENRGYGAAVRSGMSAATSDYIFLTDGDLQFDLMQIDLLLPLIEDCDLVVGHRINRQDNFIRRANAHAWNWMIRKVLGIPLSDVDCAFKLIRRDLFDRLELVSEGAMISAELVAKSLQLDAALGSVGVQHRPRPAGEPTGNSPRVILRAFRELIRLRSKLVVTPHQ